MAGKYSLSVLSADRYDAETDEIILLGGRRCSVGAVAASLVGGAGFLIQRRLNTAPQLLSLFGPRLWSVRVLVLVLPTGPVIHRAVAKIATGINPADNFWRRGNMLGAIDLDSGIISRVVRGTGVDLAIDEPHPDTGQCVVGMPIPDWECLVKLVKLVKRAAPVFAGIRTQSWDIALTNRGPLFLEVNFGGDLNLAQLANGEGVLDEIYTRHLRTCGYRI